MISFWNIWGVFLHSTGYTPEKRFRPDVYCNKRSGNADFFRLAISQPWQLPDEWSSSSRILSNGCAGCEILGAEVRISGSWEILIQATVYKVLAFQMVVHCHSKHCLWLPKLLMRTILQQHLLSYLYKQIKLLPDKASIKKTTVQVIQQTTSSWNFLLNYSLFYMPSIFKLAFHIVKRGKKLDPWLSLI